MSAENQFVNSLNEENLLEYKEKSRDFGLSFDEFSESYDADETIEKVEYMTDDEIEEFIFSDYLYQIGWKR